VERTDGRDVRSDGQLASLFRLQATPDDMCGNKARLRAHVTRIHLYLICAGRRNGERKGIVARFRFSLTRISPTAIIRWNLLLNFLIGGEVL